MSTAQKTDYFALIFYAVLLCLAVLLVMCIFKVEPVASAVNGGLNWVAAKVGGFNLGSITSYVTNLNNLPTLITVAGGASTIAFTAWKAYSSSQQAKAAVEAASQANIAKINAMAETATTQTAASTQAKTAQTQIDTLTTKLAEYESDPALGTLQQSYSASQTKITELQGQVNLLNQKLEAEIQNRPVITQKIVT
jgi:hypothetical protein